MSLISSAYAEALSDIDCVMFSRALYHYLTAHHHCQDDTTPDGENVRASEQLGAVAPDGDLQ
jgi:hypothetical protein